MKRYVLVDSFKGKVSDFADEETYSVFNSRELAIRDVACRFAMIYHENPNQFRRVTDIEIVKCFSQGDDLRIVSNDGCEYRWKIKQEI